MKIDQAACPCGKGLIAACCGPFLKGDALAPTAEALMRSRYTGYAQGDSDYVLRTWHSSTRPAELNLRDEQDQGQWIGLSVMAHKPMGDRAEVEFVARYKPKGGGAAQRLHERSRFVKEGGRWYYLDGEVSGS